MPYSIRRYTISYVAEGYSTAEKITTKDDVAALARQRLQYRPLETVLIMALDSSNRIIGFRELEGIANGCVVFPQQVFSFALGVGAASVIMAHNHPGGTPRASDADWKITKLCRQAGDLLQVPLLDHIIIADEIISLRETPNW